MSSPSRAALSPPSRLSACLWVVLGTLSLRMVAVIAFGDSPYLVPRDGDMAFYHRWALRILAGEWTDGKAFYGMPGYPFLLAGIYRIFGVNLLAVSLVQSLVDAVTGVWIYLLAREMAGAEPDTPKPRGIGRFHAILPFVAAFAWAVLQPAVAYSLMVMPSSWLTCGFWAAVSFLVKCGRTIGLRGGFGVGCTAGILATIGPASLALVPLGAGAAWFSAGTVRRRVGAVLAIALGTFAGLAPCWFHNRFLAGEPVVLSAHSGLNFFIGNNPEADGYPHIPRELRSTQEEMMSDSIRLAESAEGRRLTRAGVSRFWSGRAKDWILAHPSDWGRLVCRKIGNFWNAFEYDDQSALAIFRYAGILLPGTTFGIVALVGLPGLLVGLWRGNRATRMVASAVLLFFVTLIPMFVTERYRLPVVPGLILLGLLFVRKGVTDLLGRRLVPGAAWLLLLLGSAAFVWRPRDREKLSVHDLHNVGCAAAAAGDFAFAEERLVSAAERSPDMAETHYALGNLRAHLGRFDQARGSYLRAVEIDPGHGRAWNDLAVLAMVTGDRAAASRAITRAADLLPGDAETLYLKAVILAGDENLDAALVAARESVRVAPDGEKAKHLVGELEARVRARETAAGR